MKPGAFSKLDQERYRNRSLFLAFCSRHPGAMTAHFLNAVRLRVRGAAGQVTQTRDLRGVNLAEWARDAGLSETRDCREMLTLATVMDHLNKDDFERAADTLVCRMQALLRAKQKGGSWEKASKMELIPEIGGAELGPAGLSGLTS